jgi:HEAT repeat protein
MRRTRVLAIAAGIAAIALGWVLIRWPLRPPGAGEPATDAATPLPSSPRLVWTPGARQVYALAAETEVRLGAPGREPAVLRQVLGGRLHLRVLEFDGAKARVALQLSDLCLSGGGFGPDAARDLSHPHVAEFSADGSLRRVVFPPEVTPIGRLQLEESLRTFQTVLPEGAGSTWTVEEDHSMGRYAAAYSRDGRCEISKRKTAYIAAGADGGVPGAIEIRRSLTRIRVDPAASWIDRSAVEEDLVQSIDGRSAIASTVRATLERLPSAASPGLAIDGEADRLLAGMRAADRSGDLSRPPAGPPARPGKAAGPKELAALRDGVLQFDRIGGRNRSVLFELRRLLREYPDLAWPVRELLDDPSLKPDTITELYHLLEQAGTPEAQQVLQDIIDDPGRSHSNRLQAVIALGGTAWPTDESLEVLWQVAERRAVDEDLANTASLSLGRMGSSLRDKDPGRYEPLRARLLARLESSGGSLEKSNLLTSIGNTCDRSLSGAVAPYLAAESSQVRDAAAGALGSLPSEGTADCLTRRLPRESDGGVRTSIVESLRRLEARGPETAAIVDGLALREPDAGARFAMARYLAESLGTFPASRPTLQRMMDTDGSERIRNYLARKLLAPPAESIR